MSAVRRSVISLFTKPLLQGEECATNNGHRFSRYAPLARYDRETIKKIITWNSENLDLFGPLRNRNTQSEDVADNDKPSEQKTGESPPKMKPVAEGVKKNDSNAKKSKSKQKIAVLKDSPLSNQSEKQHKSPRSEPVASSERSITQSQKADDSNERFVTRSQKSDDSSERSVTRSQKADDIAVAQSPIAQDLSFLDPVMTFPFFPVENVSEFNHRPPELPEITIPGYSERAAFENPFFPSVGTILSTTQPPESRIALARWRKKMVAELGEEGFKKHHRAILDRGINFHSCIEGFLQGQSESDLDIDPRTEGFWESSRGVRGEVSDVRGVEETVIHRHLCYKGNYDCVARFRGELCLIDWKTSKTTKADIRWTYDNPLQVAAYVGALNFDPAKDMQLDKALIVVSYEDGQPAHSHLLSRAMCVDYWGKWLHRLHQYWALKLQDKVPPANVFD